MKVEFTVEESTTMFDAVVDQIVKIKLSKQDKAMIRRWRTEMSPGSHAMQLLGDKINAELEREHTRSEVSAIKKPDWAS
ncbi:MAG: hypothetical protein CL792_03475 [Chloroflexi bacterium]|nr:hypothetical protein [Chloroflexota bacterium]|tara:strand:+ start:245 stop:481 length:237 start_codon:yes stop_codon:yes gene_type:complete